MTLAHRRRHLVMWTILLPLLVIGLTSALKARKPRAVSPAIPREAARPVSIPPSNDPGDAP